MLKSSLGTGRNVPSIDNNIPELKIQPKNVETGQVSNHAQGFKNFDPPPGFEMNSSLNMQPNNLENPSPPPGFSFQIPVSPSHKSTTENDNGSYYSGAGYSLRLD
mmetsp:Transcript_5053/g.6141  ORF Transcript_5053/g.6141 Transcript_5053/m.6141 type:complete len:105 (+) Transcript_5053:45-359(+)